MSTSFIYHAFGLSGYEYVHQKFEGGVITMRVRPGGKWIRCPKCKSAKVIHRGVTLRYLRTLPLGFKPMWLLVEVPRVQCRCCGCVRRIRLHMAAQRRGYTRGFERFVIELSKVMTLKDISRVLGVGWDCVKDIVKRHLAKRYAQIDLSNLEYIAIDEISVKKGHKYLTLVMDLQRGRIVFVGDGKGADALKPFWEQLSRSGAKLKAVAIDMSPAYIFAVTENIPHVPIVFDHFHVVKLMSDTITQIRRGLYRELKDGMQKEVLKGSRWILLKNHENLNVERNEHQRLAEALRLNEPLATAYYLQEDLRQLWSQPDKNTAQSALTSWLEKARISGIGPLMRMAKTVACHSFGILNWYDHPISSGPLEGTNNKIKVLKRKAYGYRDMEFFKLRILNIHNATYSLAG